MTDTFHTAPMKDGIRYNSRGEPIVIAEEPAYPAFTLIHADSDSLEFAPDPLHEALDALFAEFDRNGPSDAFWVQLGRVRASYPGYEERLLAPLHDLFPLDQILRPLDDQETAEAIAGGAQTCVDPLHSYGLHQHLVGDHLQPFYRSEAAVGEFLTP